MKINSISDLYDLFESEGATYGLANFVNEDIVAGIEDEDLRDQLRLAWHAAAIVDSFQDYVYRIAESEETT